MLNIKYTYNILVIVSPFYGLVGQNLFDLLELLKILSNKIYLLQGKRSMKLFNKIKWINKIPISNKLINILRKRNGFLNRIISYGLVQLIIAKTILMLRRQVDIILFYQSEGFIPALLSRVMQKKVLFYRGGSGFRSLQAGNIQDKLLSVPFFIGEMITMFLAHRIILVTHRIETPMYFDKISIAPTRILDLNFFKRYSRKKKIDKLEPIIGYVGRLSPEKGVENLVDAFSILISKVPSAKLLIVGDGALRLKIEKKLLDYKIEENVKITGWVDNVETYLNEIKILVIPSETEGLPSIVLEAMACETPILASPVGAIPDIIKNRETGFLLKFNDPKYMSNRIMELLDKPETIEKVSINANRYVKENFSYEKTLEAWQKIFSEFVGAQSNQE